jgi:hypothetical protein
VFGRLWAATGCRAVLKSLGADRRFCFDVERAVYLTVLHRLMISGSDRHANDWCSQVRVPGAEGLDRDHAYKAMAWLGEVDAAAAAPPRPSRKRSIAAVSRGQPLFGAVSIAFVGLRCALMRPNQRVSAPGLRSADWLRPPAAHATRDLPLPTTPKGAILASNHRESEECWLEGDMQ